MHSNTQYTHARRARGRTVTLVLLLALVSGVVTANAGGLSSARSLAMGGAHIGLARGVDAVKYNPANLGLTDHRRTGFELVGVGANITNNSFTLDDYNKYTGAFLTGDDKEYLLGRVPDEGLLINADVEATAASLALGSFALTVSGYGAADVNLNRDIIDLVLNGNSFADTIDVTGSYSNAMSYASAGISHGFPVYNAGNRQLAVGATVKYIYGIAIEEVVDLEGLAATYETGFAGEGRMVARTATGGSGFAVDLGAALQWNKDYVVGASIRNFYGRVTWNDNTEEHGYVFEFDTMTVDNIDEDYVTSDDYSRDIDNFSTSLPAVLTLGIARTTGSVKWAVDWEQGLNSKPGASTKPRLAAGAEWSPVGVLPLRAGYAFGGGDNAAFSFGTGVLAGPFYLDAAMVTGTSFSVYSTKGANLAVSTGLYF